MHHDQVKFIPETQEWLNIRKSINIKCHINRTRGKKRMITSIDTEKAFDKIQHTFMINALRNQEQKGTFSI